MTSHGTAVQPRVVLDCRWLGTGGAGRLTELLLRGLGQLPEPPAWTLWGPPSVHEFLWPGAEAVETSIDPRTFAGQRSLFDIPEADLVVFMHQQRPLRRVRSVTLVLDTIPLRHGSTAPVRKAKLLYLRRVVAISTRVITISSYSGHCIARDLHVPADRVSVLAMPFDGALAARVLELRRTAPARNAALYVGNLLPHKNVPRLVHAFGQTQFCREGGRLVLVGGSPSEMATLLAQLSATERAVVDPVPRCTQSDLDLLYASVRFLVQPSLEEGFGLPAWEALSCGLPVASSAGLPLSELVRRNGEVFAATSAGDISQALDRCAARSRNLSWLTASQSSASFRATAPTLGDFARHFHTVVHACADRAIVRNGAADLA